MADALNVPQPSRPAGRRFGGLTIPTGEEQLAGGWIHTTAAPPQTWHHLFARARIAFLWNTLLNAYDTCGGRLANGRRLLAIQAEQGDAAAAKAAGKFGMPPPERVAQLERTNSLLFRALRYMAMAFGRYAEHEVDSLFEHAGAMTAPDQADSQVRMLWSPWNIIEGPTDRSDATGGTLDDFTGTIDCLLRDTSHSMGAAAAHRSRRRRRPAADSRWIQPGHYLPPRVRVSQRCKGPCRHGHWHPGCALRNRPNDVAEKTAAPAPIGSSDESTGLGGHPLERRWRDDRLPSSVGYAAANFDRLPVSTGGALLSTVLGQGRFDLP